MASVIPVLLAALCSALFVACLATPTARILEGSEAATNDFPFMASVRCDNIHVCGGSIIAVNYILTAAHCVSELGTKALDPKRVTIRVGSTNQYAGGNLISIANITINAAYGSFLNDVALLKTSTDLPIGPRVQIIPLAESIEAGKDVTVAGWGRTVTGGDYAYKLQFGEATTISAEDCEALIGFGYVSTLCLKNKSGKGSCNGDAGGPAIYENTMIGVSNLVIGTCGTIYPDVFASVPNFVSWIKEIIETEET